MRHTLSILVLILASAALGCGESSSPAVDCGEGGDYSEDGVVRYCAYVVVKGGFECPEALPFRIDIGEGAVCSSVMVSIPELPESVCKNFDEVCGMSPTPDGGGDADVPGEFMCGGEGEGLQINLGAFEGTSCDNDLGGVVHLKEVTSATGSAGDFLVRFDFYNCPERDNSCLCRLSVATQPGFETVFNASSLKNHHDEDVTISLITTPTIDIAILGATPVRLSVLFGYKTGVDMSGALPESRIIVFGGALVATLDGSPVDQTCTDGPLSGDVFRTKVEFRTDVSDADTVVRSTTFLQSGSIDGEGGDKFSLWTVDAVDDPEQSYVHRWIVVPR